jgi:hypothetical protein
MGNPGVTMVIVMVSTINYLATMIADHCFLNYQIPLEAKRVHRPDQ